MFPGLLTCTVELYYKGVTEKFSLQLHAQTALQAATILVAMASGKNIWRLNFWRKSPIGDLQVKEKLA